MKRLRKSSPLIYVAAACVAIVALLVVAGTLSFMHYISVRDQFREAVHHEENSASAAELNSRLLDVGVTVGEQMLSAQPDLQKVRAAQSRFIEAVQQFGLQDFRHLGIVSTILQAQQTLGARQRELFNSPPGASRDTLLRAFRIQLGRVNRELNALSAEEQRTAQRSVTAAESAARSGRTTALIAVLLMVALIATLLLAYYVIRLDRRIVAERRAREQADRLKTEFIGLVSHDLRTPLTSIKGYLDLYLKEGVEEPTPRGRQYLEVVRRNADRLENMIGDVLLIAQAEASNLTIDWSVLDLSQVAGQCVESALPNAREKHIDLAFRPGSVGEWSGDRDRLAQLFDNLISNALKYTPEGGRVEVRLSRCNGHVLAEVEDSGIGIAATDKKQVFERFFRGAEASKKEIPGVGLGLSVVKAIAEGHGGHISVESDEGVGTTFRVELPFHDHMESEDAQPRTESADAQHLTRPAPA